jgi:hypothetical protein
MGRFAKTRAGRGKSDMARKDITSREQNATATDKNCRFFGGDTLIAAISAVISLGTCS